MRCSPSGWPFCRAWCARFTALVHDELEKEYVVAARLDGATTFNILWFAVLPNIAAGLVTEITRALSMAILDIAALGFRTLARSSPPRNGALCLAMRWS